MCTAVSVSATEEAGIACQHQDRSNLGKGNAITQSYAGMSFEESFYRPSTEGYCT